jgi:hypothetical protein
MSDDPGKHDTFPPVLWVDSRSIDWKQRNHITLNIKVLNG